MWKLNLATSLLTITSSYKKISKAITRQLKDEILVTPKLRLVKKGSLPQSEGKAVRVKDLRDNK